MAAASFSQEPIRTVAAAPTLASIERRNRSLAAICAATGRFAQARDAERSTPSALIRFIGARANNLKNVDVEIPLGMMVAVTGVSGSGKSSLVHDVIYRALDLEVNKERQHASAARWKKAGSRKLPLKRVERAESADQRRHGGSIAHRPNASLESGHLYQGFRYRFAICLRNARSAAKRGYTAGHFSFNIPGGRCETCQGDGTVTVEMQFLADVELVCEECKGTRYKQSVLDIPYKGLNIHEVLQLTVREALSFFAGTPRLAARLKVLEDVGLGLSPAGAVRHHPEWRRGAARQISRASRASKLRGNTLSFRRANHRLALRRYR